jgi:hypothetical protein
MDDPEAEFLMQTEIVTFDFATLRMLIKLILVVWKPK